MADKESIAFKVEIDGVEREIKSLKDLKQAKKDATDAFLRGDKDAAKALANLKDKTEDLTDATKSLKGSGVESLNSSFRQLAEGVTNFDGDKISTAFKGIGSAMKAIPIFLLIEGLRYLIENFDEVSGAVKRFFNVASESEKAIKALEKANANLRETNKGLISTLENEIKILEAQGGSQQKILTIKKEIIQAKIKEAELDIALQKNKIQEILLNDSLTESYYRGMAATQRRLGNDKAAAIFDGLVQKEKQERLKESSDLLRADLITINSLKTESIVTELKYEKDLTTEKKKELDKRLVDQKKHLDDLHKQTIASQNSLDLAIKSLGQVQKTEKLTAEKEEGEVHLQQIDSVRTKEYEDHKKFEDNKAAYTADIGNRSLQGLQGLSDLYFMFKSKNLKKGSKEEEEQAKKQFNINKALSLATATISGIQGVQAAYSSGAAVPVYGAVLGPLYAAAAGLAAAANIAKIANSSFDGGNSGNSGGGGAPSAPSVSGIPAPPTLSKDTSTKFDDSGKNLGSSDQGKRQDGPIRLGVNEYEEKKRRVEVIENQSTF